MSYSKKQMSALVVALSEEHGFSEASGLEMLDRMTKKVVKPSMPLPWCGLVQASWCDGLRLNHGLLSQCTNEAGGLCSTCSKQADEDGRPSYGLVSDRVLWESEHSGELFRNHKGKTSRSFGSVMKKLSIRREDAEAEALRFGLTIREDDFAERCAVKGRPKKSSSASDSDEDMPKRGRGRPRKEVKKVGGSVGDDLIASLVRQASGSESVSESLKEVETKVVKSAKGPSQAALKAECKAAGLKVTGNKGDLLARLAEHASVSEVVIKEEVKEESVSEVVIKEEVVSEEVVSEVVIKEESVSEVVIKEESVSEVVIKEESVSEVVVKEESVSEVVIKEEVKEEVVSEEVVSEVVIKEEVSEVVVSEESVSEVVVKEVVIKEEVVSEVVVKEVVVSEVVIKEEAKAKSPKAKSPKGPSQAALKAECKAAGLKVTGNKGELLDRLSVYKAQVDETEEVTEDAMIEEVVAEETAVVVAEETAVVVAEEAAVVVAEETAVVVAEEDSDEEELVVSKWECPADGKMYLKSEDDQVFDLESQEDLGKWDGSTIVEEDED
jgi:hypothetical protein